MGSILSICNWTQTNLRNSFCPHPDTKQTWILKHPVTADDKASNSSNDKRGLTFCQHNGLRWQDLHPNSANVLFQCFFTFRFYKLENWTASECEPILCEDEQQCSKIFAFCWMKAVSLGLRKITLSKSICLYWLTETVITPSSNYFASHDAQELLGVVLTFDQVLFYAVLWCVAVFDLLSLCAFWSGLSSLVSASVQQGLSQQLAAG